MRGCRFIQADHTYWIGDQRVPGIHEVLEAGGLLDTQWYTREGKIKGTEVHRLALAYDLEDLDPDFDSPYRGYQLSYEALRPDLHVRWDECEIPSYSWRYRCATRIDRIGTFLDPSPYAGRRVIADFKSGAPEDWHGIQLAGGELIRGLPTDLVRLSIYLKPKGRGRAFVHKQPGDRRKFLRALELYWKGE